MGKSRCPAEQQYLVRYTPGRLVTKLLFLDVDTVICICYLYGGMHNGRDNVFYSAFR